MAAVTHYTSFDAALQILLSGKIKLGDIRNCNDQIEIDNLPTNQEDNYYIFCSSEKNFDSLMWFAYAKNKFGACITFQLKKRKQKKMLLKRDDKLGNWRTGNVKYDTKSQFEVGFIKDKIFKREKEYRFLCITKNKQCVADINWGVVEDVTLTISTFFDKKIISDIFIDLPVKVNIEMAKSFNY